MQRELAAGDRIMERAFCAGPVDRLTIGLLAMCPSDGRWSEYSDRSGFGCCDDRWRARVGAVVTSSSVGSEEVVAVFDPVVCRESLSARGRCPAGPSALPDVIARGHR